MLVDVKCEYVDGGDLSQCGAFTFITQGRREGNIDSELLDSREENQNPDGCKDHHPPGEMKPDWWFGCWGLSTGTVRDKAKASLCRAKAVELEALPVTWGGKIIDQWLCAPEFGESAPPGQGSSGFAPWDVAKL